MPKLATPVQYEPALEGLNDIRPLALADEGKVVIPYPVLCKNPPSVNRPAVGKFARCSQQGALLKSDKVWADKIQLKDIFLDSPHPSGSILYTPKVVGVLAFLNVLAGLPVCNWTSRGFEQFYIEISRTEWTFLPFRGKIIYVHTSGVGGWLSHVVTMGFYK